MISVVFEMTLFREGDTGTAKILLSVLHQSLTTILIPILTTILTTLFTTSNFPCHDPQHHLQDFHFLISHYGSLESYFQVMSLDIMEGF